MSAPSAKLRQRLKPNPPSPQFPQTEEEARQTANARNPQLVAARESEEASKYAIDFAVGQMLPTVSVQASYGRNGQERGLESIGDDTRVTAYGHRAPLSRRRGMVGDPSGEGIQQQSAARHGGRAPRDR